MKTKLNKILPNLILLLLLVIAIKCGDDPVTPPSPPNPDSTSHEIVWEIDTLGAFNSSLNAVWGSSPTNVWVTGWLTDGKGWGSNISHYDGVEWKAHDYYEANLNGLFGISENDIWAVGNNLTATQWYALVAHYDGVEWKTEKVFDGIQSLSSVWASSKENVFAVGGNGTILHYDGNSWTLMNSGTDRHLKDVWGFGPNDVYAVGGNDSSGSYRPIILHYDGNNWESILDSTANGYDLVYSIWGTISDNVYYTSSFGFFQGSIANGWISSIIPDDHTEKIKLRGSSEHNIFIAGHFGLLLHYNGNSWHRYDEIFSKSYPYGPTLADIATFENSVLIVGDEGNSAKAIVYRGTIKN